MLSPHKNLDEPYPSGEWIAYYDIYSGAAHGEHWAILKDQTLRDDKTRNPLRREAAYLNGTQQAGAAAVLSVVAPLNRVGLRLGNRSLVETAASIAELSDRTLHLDTPPRRGA